MPPRCIAIRNQATKVASQDGIWINDAMLGQAIERFNRVLGERARHMSSCPGPIEARRRLGKRHMTAVMPDSPYVPPLWSTRFPLRLDEWKWEPPSTPEARALKNQKFSLGRIVDRFISSLENYDDQPVQAAAAAAIPEALPPVENTFAPASIPLEVDDNDQLDTVITSLNRHLTALDLESMNEDDVMRECTKYFYGIRPMIWDGSFTSRELLTAMQPFDFPVKGRLRNKTLKAVQVRIATRFLRDFAQHNKHRNIPSSIWKVFMDHFQNMDRQEYSTYVYYCKLTEALPRIRQALLSSTDIAEAVASYILFEASASSPTARMAEHRPVIIPAIMHLAPKHVPNFWNRVMEILKARGTDRDLETLQRLTALMMSFDPRTTIDECLDMYPDCLSEEDAFLFVKGRIWVAVYKRDPSRAWRKARLPARKTYPDWGLLVRDIFHRSEDPRDLLQEAAMVAKRTGHFDSMITHVAEDPRRTSACLREVAWVSDDVEAALYLWEAARSRYHIKALIKDWNWTHWTRYVEAMVKNPNVTTQTIWRVLALNWDQPNKGDGRTHTEFQTGLIELMSEWFIEANYLSDREKLRAVEECMAVYQSIDRQLSQRMLACLANVTIRDLQKGRRGSKERYAWFISFIQEFMGPEEAEKVLVQIQGWVWTVGNKPTYESRLRSEKSDDKAAL